jgi:hypothetical protein
MRGQSTARISCVAQRVTVTAMRTTSYWESALALSGFHLNRRIRAVHKYESAALSAEWRFSSVWKLSAPGKKVSGGAGDAMLSAATGFQYC